VRSQYVECGVDGRVGHDLERVHGGDADNAIGDGTERSVASSGAGIRSPRVKGLHGITITKEIHRELSVDRGENRV
jgi:hypothetical protein